MRRKMPSKDYISDIPPNITEIILTKMPLRDAVRTSILSTTWRYKWATLTHLDFNDKCVSATQDKALTEINLVKFITRFLFLHDGPINKFALSTTCLKSSPDLDQWLLFLSRKDVKELVLKLKENRFQEPSEFILRAPSCLFSCQKLVRLEIDNLELDLPCSFKGFPLLKHLKLDVDEITLDDVQNLISSCPLLETLDLVYFGTLELIIHAPNIKYLTLEGDFINICFGNTPKLVEIFVYTSDEIVDKYGQISSCNIDFDKFLGGLPLLEKICGRNYFTQYMSVSNTFGETLVTHWQLKVIELYHVNFRIMNEIMLVLRLLSNAPNLQELELSGSPDYESSETTTTEALDLDFWGKECPIDCKYERLKRVVMFDISGFPHEVGFIGFLLRKSPVLKTMSITAAEYVTKDRSTFLMELLRFKRASTEAELIFAPFDG